MMRPDAKVQKVYLYPKPVDFRKSINGLAALVELDIKVEVLNPVLFVFLTLKKLSAVSAQSALDLLCSSQLRAAGWVGLVARAEAAFGIAIGFGHSESSQNPAVVPNTMRRRSGLALKSAA
jgi:hypothetical protein